MDDVLPERVSITEEQLAAFDSHTAFSVVAHKLYKEAAALILVSAGIRFPDEPHLHRNHAILAGLLIRIYKFMLGIAVLTAAMPRCREVVYALNRCIAETLINALYLMQHGDNEQLFDDFVTKSLGPEKEQLEEINSNVAQHGGIPSVMETRMLESIARTFDRSGVDPANVPIKHQEWATNMRERLKALGWKQGYALIYRANSHAIHGTWVDLLLNNLEYIGADEFDVDPDCGFVDSRLLSPVAQLALQAAGEYVTALSQRAHGCEPILERIKDLDERIELVSLRFETYLQRADA